MILRVTANDRDKVSDARLLCNVTVLSWLMYLLPGPCLSYCRVQWLRGRSSDSRLREPRFKFCAAVLKPWAIVFTLHCFSSLSYINEYMAIDSGGYVDEQPSRITCGIWLDASQRSWDGVWLNRSVREVKCKSNLRSPEDWILRYIRTYLFLLVAVLPVSYLFDTSIVRMLWALMMVIFTKRYFYKNAKSALQYLVTCKTLTIATI